MSGGIEVYTINRWRRWLDKLNGWVYTRSWWLLLYFSGLSIIGNYGTYDVVGMLLCALELLLVHMTLFMEHRRTGRWLVDGESKIMPRLFMTRFGGYPNPKNYVLAVLILAPLVAVIINSGIATGLTEGAIGAGSIIGMYVVANIYHIGVLTK